MFNGLLSKLPLGKKSTADKNKSAARKEPSDPSDNQPSPGTGSRVMRLYGGSQNEQRSSCMGQIIADSMTYLEEVGQSKTLAKRRATTMRSSMVATVNQAFAILQSCSEELNHALGTTELWLSTTAPAFVYEPIRRNRNGEVVESITTFRARIASGCLSLVMRAEDSKIGFYVIPADKVVGLSIAEKHYDALMTFTAVGDGVNIKWEVEDKPLTDERLERYCVEFFKYFIEESRTEHKKQVAKRGERISFAPPTEEKSDGETRMDVSPQELRNVREGGSVFREEEPFGRNHSGLQEASPSFSGS